MIPCKRATPHCRPVGQLSGARYVPGVCRACWKFENDANFRARWSGESRQADAGKSPARRPEKKQAKRQSALGLRRRPCQYFGEATGDTIECPTCPKSPGGKISLKVFQCAMHSRCIPGHTAPSVHGCLDCPDYSPDVFVPDAGSVRHLLFHCWPFAGNHVWRWHAEQLRRRIGLFNGKKILAVVTDRQSDSADTVKAVMGDLFDEVIVSHNNPTLREVATFESLFSRVRSTKRGEAVLWAHAKGVGRGQHPAVRRWAELQYDLYMDRWGQAVKPVLEKYPVAGAFLKMGAGWSPKESRSDWHYSGSWCWYRSRDLFGQSDWRRIDQFWSGIEPYPSLHFSRGEAGCIFHEAPVPQMNLYDAACWMRTVEPAYRAWVQQLSRPVMEGLKVELGGGKTPRGSDWINVDALDCPGVQYRVDFESLARADRQDVNRDGRLPFDDDSVANVYSAHCFEHIANLHGLLHELVRVCKVGASVEVRVPHWLSPMALCHDHKQVIPPEQVEHWCSSAIDYWWAGCTKRLKHISTEQIPGGNFGEAKHLHPSWADDQIMRYVPGAAHEVCYRLEVISR